MKWNRSLVTALAVPIFLVMARAQEQQPLINPGMNQGNSCPLAGALPTNNSTPQSTGASCEPQILNRTFSVTFGAGAPHDYAGLGDQRAGTAGGTFGSAADATTGTGTGTSAAGAYGTGTGTFGAGIGTFGTFAGAPIAGTDSPVAPGR